MRLNEGITNLQMTSLKKHLWHMPEDGRRVLKTFLSTSYGLSMEIQGALAALQDQERRSEVLSLIRMTLENSQELSDLTGDLESLTGSTLGSGNPLKGA